MYEDFYKIDPPTLNGTPIPLSLLQKEGIRRGEVRYVKSHMRWALGLEKRPF